MEDKDSVKKQKRLDQIFMALADPTRRTLIHRLASCPLTMSQLAEGFEMSLAAISKHVKILEKSGLVKRKIEGRTHTISLAPEPLTAALDWISIYRNFWQQRMNVLSDIINKEEEN